MITTVVKVLDDDRAFRSLVADEATEDVVGRAGWLYLHRPEGWDDELDQLVATEDGRRREQADAVAERSAEHRRRALEQVVADLRARLEATRSVASQDAAERVAERERRQAVEATLREVQSRLETAEAERSRAVADLTAARLEAERRRSRIVELEEDLAALRADRASWSAPLAGHLDEALGAVEAAARALRTAAMHLEEPAPLAVMDGPVADAERSERTAVRRRVPMRLAQGAVDDTVEATDQLLRAPAVVVLVDGYNVSMQRWPHLEVRMQRERLLSLLGDVVARTGSDVRVVFDGVEDGRRPTVTGALPVRIHYSPGGVEADDVIIGMVGDLPADRPVVVVSSDRRVRDASAAGGANLVHSAALWEWHRR